MCRTSHRANVCTHPTEPMQIDWSMEASAGARWIKQTTQNKPANLCSPSATTSCFGFCRAACSAMSAKCDQATCTAAASDQAQSNLCRCCERRKRPGAEQPVAVSNFDCLFLAISNFDFGDIQVSFLFRKNACKAGFNVEVGVVERPAAHTHTHTHTHMPHTPHTHTHTHLCAVASSTACSSRLRLLFMDRPRSSLGWQSYAYRHGFRRCREPLLHCTSGHLEPRIAPWHWQSRSFLLCCNPFSCPHHQQRSSL